MFANSSVGGKFLVLRPKSKSTNVLCLTGIRISLYNAVTLDQVDKIVAFIKEYYVL
jgi:hypothetical protein